MIFYFELTANYEVESEDIQENGLIVAQSYTEAVKQIENQIGDFLLSVGKLEAIDGRDILYLTDNILREPLIQLIKEEAVW